MTRFDEIITLQHEGGSRGEILAAMKERGFTLVQAIKVSMQVFGMGLGDAKMLVTSDPSWSAMAAAAVPFQDELVQLFQTSPDVDSGPAGALAAEVTSNPGR